MLAEVLLPTQDSETDATGYDEESHEVGGYGAAAGKVQVDRPPSTEGTFPLFASTILGNTWFK